MPEVVKRDEIGADTGGKKHLGLWGDQEEESDAELTSAVSTMLHMCGTEKLKTAQGETIRIERPEGSSSLVAIKKWEELALSSEKRDCLLRGLYGVRFDRPFKIQEAALPLILAGFATRPRTCLLAQAKSGSGKTAAFVLGMLHNVDLSLISTQALCVCPTRELALQNANVAKEIGSVLIDEQNLVVAVVVSEDRRQVRAREAVRGHVVVGTPGKCMEKIQRGRLEVSRVSTFVLDEADEMDAKGLRETTRELRRKLPVDCQVLCFSATYTRAGIKDIENSVFLRHRCEKLFVEPNAELREKRCGADPLRYEDGRVLTMVDDILHVWCDASQHPGGKDGIVEDIFDLLQAQQAYIFVATRNQARQVQRLLEAKHFSTVVLTGGAAKADDGMTGEQRDRAMADFRDGKIKVMITTNVLSRGIDVVGVNVVINYDLPVVHETQEADLETYIHRVGRTGRAGAKGLAINLVMGNSPREMKVLGDLEKSCFGLQTTPWTKIQRVPDATDVEYIKGMAANHLQLKQSESNQSPAPAST